MMEMSGVAVGLEAYYSLHYRGQSTVQATEYRYVTGQTYELETYFSIPSLFPPANHCARAPRRLLLCILYFLHVS